MRFQSLAHGIQRLGSYENSLRLALGFASLTSATWLVTAADDENDQGARVENAKPRPNSWFLFKI